MKLICHITTVHPARDTRIFYKECKSLAGAGYDVKLLVINGESFEEEGVKVIGVPCHFSGRLKRFRKASKAIYNAALHLNADLYHFHDPEVLPSATKLVKKGKKVIYDVHEDVPRQLLSKHYIPRIFRKSVAFVTEKFENHYASKMSGIITATEFIRDRFSKIHKQVIDIKNYPVFNELDKEAIKKDKKAEIFYVGSITRERGITELVKALEKTNSNIRLNLAGKYAPDQYRNDLAGLKGWQKVNEIGFADRKKVEELSDRSFAGIVTLQPIINYLDALPVKMFEYMVAGLPVIASDFPLWKEIVEGNQCGLCVDPMNPDEISQAIDHLFANPEEAQKMGTNGRNAVIEKYNWDLEEKKLIGFYKKLLND
ncbi:MAG: glycosyltransferase family 4 protein [Bacteroidetes bacterium]|nr:glycosyltransferase family 4 protein [Bacteroidota bacterium]